MAITRNEFFEAIRKVVSSEFEHIPKNEDEIEYHFSASFMKRMLRLFRNQKKSYWKYVNTVGKRVAVIFAAAAILFATACSIKPIREPIMRFITEVYETFTAYFFEGDAEEKVIEKVYELDPVPEGFVEVSRTADESVVSTTYENASGDTILVYQAMFDGLNLNLDTENDYAQKEIVDGTEVMIYDLDEAKQAMFIKDCYYFQITCTGNMDIAFLKDIIKNLK